MLDLSRRSILSGMLSILAASTTQIIPAPVRALASNSLPRIHGNGRDYDSEGFQALFDGKDVLIPADKLQITGAKGLIFHRGTFVIDREVYVNHSHMIIEEATFDGRLLRWWEAFFTMDDLAYNKEQRTIIKARDVVGKAKWLRDQGAMSIDVGNHQYSIANTWMSEANRFCPKAQKEI